MEKVIKTNNIVVSAINGYTVENLKKVHSFLHNNNRSMRNINITELINLYNEIKHTNYSTSGCRSCNINKYYIGLQNYLKYGIATLIANGVISSENDIKGEDEQHIQPILENAQERLKTALEDTVEDEIIKAVEEETQDKPKRGRKKTNAEDNNQ